MEELKVQNSLLLQLVRGLQQQINSKNRQNQILFQQYDQLTNDYQHLQKTVDTLRIQNSQFKRQNIPNHENHSKLSYYEQQLAQTKQKTLQHEQIIINLRRQLQQKGGTIVFLQNQLKKPKEIQPKNNQVESLHPKIDELNSMLEMKEKSLADLTQYMNIQAEKISELTREGIIAIENYEAKIQQKQNTIKQLNENMEKLKQQMKILEQAKVEIKQDPSLNQEISSHLQKIKELNAQLQHKNQSIEELSQFMQTQAEKIAKFQLQNSLQETENRKNQIENLQAIIKNKEQSNSQLNQFLESILSRSRQMEEKIGQIPKIIEENQNLKAEINTLKNFLQDKAQQVNILKSEQEIYQEQGNYQIDILRAKLSTNQDEILHLKQIIQDRQAQLTTLRFQLDEKVLKVTEMQSLSQQNQVQFPSDNLNDAQQNNFNLSEKKIQVKQMEDVLLELQSLKLQLQEKQQYIEILKVNNNQEKYLQTDTYIENLQKQIEQLTFKLTQNSIQSNTQIKPIENINEQNKDIFSLKKQIVQLQSIVQSKSSTIAELSEYMNQQSEQLELLRQKVDQSSQKVGANELAEKNYKITELQEILKSKENSIAQLGQFLQEAYSKIAALQEEKEISQNPIQPNLPENVQAPPSQESKDLKEQINELKEQNSKQLQQINTLKAFMLQKSLKVTQQTSQIEQQNHPASQNTALNQNQQGQTLREKIKDLQETIISKDQIISDFSQFMDNQATQIAQLQSKGQNNIQVDVKNENNQNKENEYEELKSILKTKQESVSQLTEFLQQSYTKNAALQQSMETLQQEVNELKYKLDEKNSIQAQQVQNIQQQKITEREREELLENRAADIVKISGQLQILEEQFKSSQQILQKLVLQISTLQENKYSLKSQCQHLQKLKVQFTQSLNTMSQEFDKYANTAQLIPSNENNGNDHKIAQLQKKLEQYQQLLNQKQDQLGSMKQVLQTLQNEIRNKDDIIEQLQSNFKSSLQAKQDNHSEPLKLQQQYQNLGFQYSEIQSTSKQLQRQYKNQLQELNSGNEAEGQLKQFAQSERRLSDQRLNQVGRDQQLTLLQAIQQIILYSQNEGSNQKIFSYIEAIKGAYQKQTEIFQTQIRQLTDALNSLVEVNNTLTEQLQSQTIESQQAKKQLLSKQGQFTELLEKCQQLQLAHLQQIKNMRRSASTLKDQINSRPQNNQMIIKKLEDEIIALKTENIKKQSELQQLREHKNKKFVKELNNLLDSYTVNKEGEEEREIKDVEEELQKIALQRDQLKRRCFSYQGQIADLQKQLNQLSNQLQNAYKNNIRDANPSHQQAQNSAHIDSLHLNDQEGKLLNGFGQPLKLNGIGRDEQSHSCTDAQGTQRLRVACEQLYVHLNEKNAAILELQETIIKIEKGYNNEIMNLRKIIAELNNDSILLRKTLYQANPDAIDIGELIKDTFSSSEKDTEFYKPNFPVYSQSLLNIQQNHNNSYYSQAYRGGQRPKRRYQPYYQILNMGQRFMGRRCKQENPFNTHLQLQESRFKGHHSSIKYDRRY